MSNTLVRATCTQAVISIILIRYFNHFAINHFAKFINIMSIQSKIHPPSVWRIPQVFAELSCQNFSSVTQRPDCRGFSNLST